MFFVPPALAISAALELGWILLECLQGKFVVLVSSTNYNFWFYFQDLENYIQDLIPTLPQLDGLEKSFHSFYICTAVRKFLFFLDPLRTGRVRIQDILACSFLDDLLEVRLKLFYKVSLFSWVSVGYVTKHLYLVENSKSFKLLLISKSSDLFQPHSN